MTTMAVEKMELKPNRALLDANFNGYKLSLDSMPLFTAAPTGLNVKARMPDEEQFSFLHVKLFGQSNNFLCSDPFDDGRGGSGVYVLNPQEGNVMKVNYSTGAGTSPELVEVWSVPAGLKPTRPGDYNPSLCFASENIAVFANGSGMIFILNTGDRKSSSEWRSVFHEEICGSDRPFTVASAVCEEATGLGDRGTVLNCLLLYVEAKEKVDGFEHGKHLDPTVNFVNVVEWMTFAAESDLKSTCWGLDRVRRFVFPGGIDFAQLTSTASHFVSCTTKPFFLVFDTMGGSLEEEDLVSGKMEKKNAAAVRPAFYYLQGVDDITVWVMLPGDAHKRDIKVSLKPRELNVSFKGKGIISGKLWDILDSEDFVWTLEKGKLEINVTKCNSGMIWQRFLAHGADDVVVSDGEEVTKPEMVEEIEREFELKDAAQVQGCGRPAGEDDPLPAYNSQELEDCDAFPEDSFAVYVYDGVAGTTVQKADLSGHQWLFNLNTSGGVTQKSVCLRHDVDGLVWEVPALREEEGTGMAPLSHAGTFLAMGYVQASKQHRKFSVAAPDLSYVAICDRSRHIYVYRQPTALADGCDLRNRKSGQRVKQISKQQVITIDDGPEEVQGAVATEAALFLLTTSRLVVAQTSS